MQTNLTAEQHKFLALVKINKGFKTKAQALGFILDRIMTEQTQQKQMEIKENDQTNY